MRSSSRNSRGKLSVLGLAAAASLLLGSAAQAGEHNFVLAAYTNGRGGQARSQSHYQLGTRTVPRPALERRSRIGLILFVCPALSIFLS